MFISTLAIEQEKQGQELKGNIEGFNKRKLRRTLTDEKNSLPSSDGKNRKM